MSALVSLWAGASPELDEVRGFCLLRPAAKTPVLALNRDVCGLPTAFRLKTFNIFDEERLRRRSCELSSKDCMVKDEALEHA